MKKIYIVAILAGIAIAVLINVMRATPTADAEEPGEKTRSAISGEASPVVRPQVVQQDETTDSEPENAAEEESAEEEPLTEEEAAAREEEKLVDEFDALTDKWYEGENTTKTVTMADVDEFAKRLKSVPAARREECLQRALNLISDDHALLLVGVLLDREIEKDLVELVFNDVLNRDEDVKKPILHEIYKDRTHPNWADVAWIFDATGEEAPKE